MLFLFVTLSFLSVIHLSIFFSFYLILSLSPPPS